MAGQPPTTSVPRKRALLVGAYERDNFGDELFLLVTEHYLAEAGYDSVAAAPFAADMTELLDRSVERFVDCLERERFDLVWTVGGEAGAITTEGAMRWSVAPELFAEYKAADGARKTEIRRQVMGGTHVETPYMPRLSAFPLNVLTPTVINSIGISGIAKASTDRRAQVLRVLREATAVSVRDPRASETLDGGGIEHTLAPDLVHTIRHMHPKPADEQSSGYVLVQVNQAQIKSIGLHRYADAIAASEALKPYPLRMIYAGLAAGHDSPDEYRQIRDRILEQDPGRDIEILDISRRPWDIVDEIRRATLWFGASLHGRIVACAYDVPRISLARGKVDVYSEAWDDGMPLKVNIDDLDAAVRSALSDETIAKAAGTGERLAVLAEENIRRSIALADAATPTELAAKRATAQEADLAIVQRERTAAVRQRDAALKDVETTTTERDAARKGRAAALKKRDAAVKERDTAKRSLSRAQRPLWKKAASRVASTRPGRYLLKQIRGRKN